MGVVVVVIVRVVVGGFDVVRNPEWEKMFVWFVQCTVLQPRLGHVGMCVVCGV